MTSTPSALPEGSVLLHIGPYKTGSTALQSSLFTTRDQFEPFGVYYPGPWRRAAEEGWSVLRWSPRGRPPPPPLSMWKDFAADIRAHSSHRVCVSTEDFAATSAVRAQEIVEDLGGDRVHVAMVARRLDRLLPSAWQERVKSHETRSYEQWLREVLDDPESQAHKAFWRSHDVARVADQWLPVVDPERFHVILMDDTDPGLLSRTFESWLGLPAGILRPPRTNNASLSANACELMRQVNMTFKEREWPDEVYHRLVYQGSIRTMVRAERSEHDEAIPFLPAWAETRIMELSEQRARDLDRLGLQVLGDRESLMPAPRTVGGASAAQPETISIAQAQAALLGAVEVAVNQFRDAEAAGSLESYGGRELLSTALRRIPRAAKRVLGRRAPTDD